jgi:hypothetical protein
MDRGQIEHVDGLVGGDTRKARSSFRRWVNGLIATTGGTIYSVLPIAPVLRA